MCAISPPSVPHQGGEGWRFPRPWWEGVRGWWVSFESEGLAVDSRQFLILLLRNVDSPTWYTGHMHRLSGSGRRVALARRP